MITKLTLALVCFLAPLLAGAGPLEAYADLTGKTILQSMLPPLPDSISSDLPADKTEAIAKIESELAKLHIAAIQDGPHFVRLVMPGGRFGSLSEVPLRGAELAASKSPATMAAGSINFINMGLEQVLPIYGQITRRTILRSAALPPVTVSLKTTTSLTIEQVAYALKTVLGLNSIAVVEDGQKFLEIVPMARRKYVTSHAPEPDPDAKLLNPNQMPSLGDAVTAPNKPLTKSEQELARVQKALYDFIHDHRPPDRSNRRLLDFYADLTDKTVQPSKQFDSLPVWFHVGMPLTRSELLYAIETTFKLENLAIIHENEKDIRLGSIAELGKGAGNQVANPQPKQ